MPIYLGGQKVKPAGIAKAYLGDKLVYQNKVFKLTQTEFTIFQGESCVISVASGSSSYSAVSTGGNMTILELPTAGDYKVNTYASTPAGAYHVILTDKRSLKEITVTINVKAK